MSTKVDLIWLGNAADHPAWPLGEVWRSELSVRAVHNKFEEHLSRTQAQAWLSWDSALGQPNPESIMELLKRSEDVWHAGLRLGQAGKPGSIDFVAPTWMLNCDPDPAIDATSWRLSLRACLIRTEALRRLGGIRPEFRTLEGAALELGHRLITRGAFMRHVPGLVSVLEIKESPPSPFSDELRFIYYRFGRWWTRWTLGRAVLSGYVSISRARQAWREIKSELRPPDPAPLPHKTDTSLPVLANAQVSVVIPTLDRYPYLVRLLEQLREQTVKPHEIIVVDQTARQQNKASLAEQFPTLPLKVIYRQEPGQCSSRNAGLRIATGNHVLFLDDDDEVSPTLIELHLKNLQAFGADVSSGVADEDGAGPLPDNFKYVRASDVFPTNNTIVRREVLLRSGLFDLAYDRGQRADGDLGMRVYLSGAAMVLNPEISVLHHHAPCGGLRTHKARVVTYAKSRSSLTTRNMPSVTEIYLARRYFTIRQASEMLWLSVFGTFSFRQGTIKRVLKFLFSLIYLPHTLWKVRTNARMAKQMLDKYPQIPVLEDSMEHLHVA